MEFSRWGMMYVSGGGVIMGLFYLEIGAIYSM